MSVYTIDAVIADCVRSYKIKELTAGAKEEIYTTSWIALNAWIETKLAKQKGAGVSGLGCFAWEIKQKDGRTTCRPIFVISEAFVKNFQVKKDRTFRIPRTTAVETVNFSNLAIKYSKSLTKDMVFVGVRDIIKKIGDLLYRGCELAVDFTFGTLRVKEKRVKFEFNVGKLSEILPESETGGSYGYDDSQLGYHLYDEEEDSAGASNFMDALEDTDYFASASQRHTDRSQRGGTAPLPAGMLLPPLSGRSVVSNPSQPATSRPESRGPTPTIGKPFESTSNPYMSGPSIKAGGTVDLKDILDRIENKALATNKKEFRRKACETVLEQAFIRSLGQIETQASRDDKIVEEYTDGYESWKRDLKAKKDKKKAETVELKVILTAQLEAHEGRRAESRQQALGSKMHVFLHDKPKLDMEKTKKDLSSALQKQISDKADTKQDSKMRDLEKERDYLKQLSMENDLNEAMQRASHLEKQKSLLEAWERDGHVRNLRKVQGCGTGAVKDYIDKNLGIDTRDQDYSSLVHKGPGKNNGQTLNMSIGYDPRKSRA